MSSPEAKAQNLSRNQQKHNQQKRNHPKIAIPHLTGRKTYRKNCHFDRSEAERRNLLLHRYSLMTP
jgi:hypothetical protein